MYQNRRNLLPCTVRTSSQGSCNEKVGCLLGYSMPIGRISALHRALITIGMFKYNQGDVEGTISSPLQLSILDVTKVKTIIIFYIFYILERAKCLDGKYLFGHSK